MQAPYKQTAVHRVWRKAAAGLSLLALIAGCGYKGPLYMPPPPAPDESLVAPPTSGTLPTTPLEKKE